MNRGEYTSFEIKVGGVYKLVGCLTAAPMSESAETIPTTTRENNGWTTELATNQSYEISLEGLAKKDGVNLPGNMISYFVLREMKRARQIIEYRIINLDGWFVDKGKAIITEIGYTDTAGEFVTFSATLKGFGKPTAQLVNPDATQVSGRNMLKNSKRWNYENWWSYNGGTPTPQGAAGIRLDKQGVTIIENKSAAGSSWQDMQAGQQYTLSFDYNGSTPFEINVGAKAIKQIAPGSVTSGRTSITFTYDNTYNGFLYITNTLPGTSVIVKDFKLEKGNKSTGWTPAPEDL